MSVCTRKDGTIFVNWMEGGIRKRRYFGKGMQAMAEAVRFSDGIVKSVPHHRKATGPLFSELVNEYTQAKASSMAQSTMNSLLYRMNNSILPQIGSIPAMRIDHSRLDAYVAHRAVSVKKTTIHRDLGYVRAILRWAVKRGLIPHNPMEGYGMPAQDNAIILPLSQGEIEALMNHASDHLKRAIMLSFFCGLRPGAVELLSITYSQVNWSEGTITVVSAKKKGVDRREVHVHPSLPLRQWYEEDGCDPSRHIITYKGRPLKSLQHPWRRAKLAAGLGGRKIPPYALRKSFVTTLLHLGVDPETIAAISGHDVVTMLKHYAHSTTISRKSAIDQLPTLHPLGAEMHPYPGSDKTKKVE